MDVIKVISLIVSILSFFGFGALFAWLWTDNLRKRREKKEREAAENDENAKLRAKLQRQAEIREVFEEGINPLASRIALIEKMLQEMQNADLKREEGIRASLRNDLLFAYYDVARKGYRTKDDSENFWDMYNAYRQLDGNSFIERDVRKWFEEVPPRDDKKGE